MTRSSLLLRLALLLPSLDVSGAVHRIYQIEFAKTRVLSPAARDFTSMNEQRRAAVMRASDPEPEGMKIGWRYRNIALPDMRILTTSKCDGARSS
jgi:hypothetical protein